MNNPVLERNLLALQRVQPELARVLIRYGGDCKVSEEFEPFNRFRFGCEASHHLAGFVSRVLCMSGVSRGEITVYCETSARFWRSLGTATFVSFSSPAHFSLSLVSGVTLLWIRSSTVAFTLATNEWQVGEEGSGLQQSRM